MDDAGDFLCMTVARKDLNLLKRALDGGIDPNAKSYVHRTPLHVAASEGLYLVAKILLQAGASVLSKDRWGNTPLDEARIGGNRNLIGLLEAARASQMSEFSDCAKQIRVPKQMGCGRRNAQFSHFTHGIKKRNRNEDRELCYGFRKAWKN